MATITKRPNTISQTTGSYASGKYYRSWTNLAELRENESFAECGAGTSNSTLISGKNGSYPRPAPLKLTNFKFNIPSTAKISKITVYYRHSKPKVNGAYPTFNAPTLDLLNVSVTAKKGSAVPTSSTEYSVSWTTNPSVSKVNSSSFGVSINYPANSSTNPGRLRLKNVRIVVTYTNVVSSTSSSSSSSSSSNTPYISPNVINNANGRIIVVGSDGSITYADNNAQAINALTGSSPNVSQTGASISKTKAYIGETVDITLTISASSKITASTVMYITMPEGVELVGKKSGNGTIYEGLLDMDRQRSGESHYWIGNFSNSTSISITFTVQLVSIGIKTFKFREDITNKETTVKINSESPIIPLDWVDSNNIITTEESAELSLVSTNTVTVAGTVISLNFEIEKSFTITFPPEATLAWDETDITVVENANNVFTVTKTLHSGDNYFNCTVSFQDIGKYNITVTDDNNNTLIRTIKVRPSNLTFPYFSKIVADEYVRDRLGNSKEYTLSSLMQIVTDQNTAELIESYDYNYRLGVFNTNLPEVSEEIALDFMGTSYWRELEGRNNVVTIENDGISNGGSVSVFGLNEEFTDSNYYTLTFDFDTTANNRLGFLLFGDPTSTITNKYSWYGIITDVGNTFIESYDLEGSPTKLFTGSKNFFKNGNNKIKIIRENNKAYIYINGELFYTLSSLSDIYPSVYNTFGFQKWGGGSVKISNINLTHDINPLNIYLLENAEWSEPISTANEWEDVKVTFAYSEEYPLIFLITGEYIESYAEEVLLKYTYPCLIEEDYRGLAENPGLYEYPIKDINTDEGATSLDLKLGESTNIAKLYDIDFTNFLESDEDNRIIQGVTVYFDVLTCDNPISIMSKLVSPSFTKEGARSLNIESVFLEEEIFQGIVSLGGTFDLWGLDYEDFKLSKLEDLEIDIQFLNNFDQAVHIEFNNLRIVFHYVELEEAKIVSKVNGVDLRYFNVFIQNVTIKPGTDNDVKYLDVEGTDSNLAYRSNIRSKEIEMEIRIPGCDLEETTAFTERLARTLINKRDKFNKPLLNGIEFSHYPNQIWKYILEDSLDVSAEFTEYEGKIKLVVPAGTSYSKEPTITNATGTNSGIAKVNPIIRVVAQGENIIVKETVSNQEWRLNDSTLEVGDILRIDCGERKVYKVEDIDEEISEEDVSDSLDVDMTDKVDFNSDWFLIHDDYNFECDNTAIIQSVTFHERW